METCFHCLNKYVITFIIMENKYNENLMKTPPQNCSNSIKNEMLFSFVISIPLLPFFI